MDSTQSLLNGERLTANTNTAPLVSVILPVYNIAEHLPKCMASLLGQSYPNLELILVDDGSTDGSSALCDEYAAVDGRAVVCHKPNGGLSDARNHGIARARGEYITCVDPDDYVDGDYVAYLYGLAQKYGARMAIGQHRVWRGDRVIHEYGGAGDEALPAKDCIERMLYHDVIDTSAWGKLYGAELFQGVTYPVGMQFEDIATTYRLMMKCESIAVGYESKYNYILRETSIVRGAFNPHKLDLLEMTDAMGREVSAAWPDLADAVLRRRVYARFSTLNQMLDTDECPGERSEIIRFIRAHAGAVLKNPKAPRRDKLAIAALAMGYPLYRRVWKLYGAGEK